MGNTKEKEIDLIELFKEIWAQRKSLIKLGAIAAVIGLLVSVSIPTEYTSEVRIAPEGNDNLGFGASASALATMVGLSSLSGEDEGVNKALYPEIISSTPFVLELSDIKVEVEEDDSIQVMDFSHYILKEQKKAWWKYILALPGEVIKLIVGEKDELPIRENPKLQFSFKNALSKLIISETDETTGIITISSTMQQKDIAHQITDSILIKLERYMAHYRTAKTRSNLISNERMLQDAKESYYQSEEAYAMAADRNQNLISKSAQIKVDRLDNQRELAFNIYSQLATQVAADKIKLQEQLPIATVIEPATMPVKPSTPGKIVCMIVSIFIFIFIKIGVITVKFAYKQEE